MFKLLIPLILAVSAIAQQNNVSLMLERPGGNGLVGTVATPTASPSAGTVSSGTSVTFSTATSGATIRYTAGDGTQAAPTSSSGTVGTSVTVTADTTYKVIAYKAGMMDSAVATFAYALPAANTFTLVQRTAPVFCNGNSNCSITVSSTGAGRLGVITAVGIGWAGTISSVSGGGTWTVPAGCATGNGNGAVSCAYTLSTASGATTINVTMSASSNYSFEFYEITPSSGTASLDTSGNTQPFASGAAFPGVDLTLTGSNDFIIQMFGGAPLTAISSPYDTHFVLPSSVNGGTSYIINSTNGTAPNWTYSSNFGQAVAGAIAFK